jgi:hypothetical protein
LEHVSGGGADPNRVADRIERWMNREFEMLLEEGEEFSAEIERDVLKHLQKEKLLTDVMQERKENQT